MRFEIHVATALDQDWSEWFHGMAIERVADDRTRLVGDLDDQAALHGVLIRVRDLGLEIISLARVDHDRKDTP